MVTVGGGGVELTLPVELASWLRLAEMRARRELPEVSLGSLLVLDDRSRPAGWVGGGVPSDPGPPPLGTSVWIKQHRLP